MANKVKIYSTLKSGKVSFDGARVNNKEIGSLEVEAHPTLSNRIRIKSLTQFKRNSDSLYRVFFGKLNINRIQNEAGQDLVATLGMDRAAVIAYIQTQITKPIVTEYFEYNPVTDRLEANKNIEVKKHGFFIGGKYKMASGNSNLYYEDLSDNSNSYPVMGEVFDQSIAANQVAGAGTSTPKMRVFGDYQSIPLGGTPVNDTAISYDGDNFFGFNISGVGITVRMGEAVTAQQQLKYEIIVGGISVYIQYLPKQALTVNQDLTWYFDHPLDIEAGTTLRATVYKVSTVNNQEVNDGILQVCEGDASPTRYQTNVLNRFFEDKDLEQISPYIKYQAMDFSVDATGSNIIMKDLSLASGSQVLTHFPINGLQAVATGTTVQVKIKDGAKIILTSTPVSGLSINGSFVNSVLNNAVLELNTLFSNAVSFNDNSGNPVTGFALSGDDLTITLQDGTSFTQDVSTFGVDTNSFVSSGALVGTNLVLTMSDSSTVTIDASNLVNGSTLTATNDEWFFAFGTNANQPVNHPNTNVAAGIGGQAPFYFGKALTRGSEIRFNNLFANKNFMLGLYDGAETVQGTFNSRLDNRWNTNFHWNGQAWIASVNTTLTTANNGASAYTPVSGSYVAIRFLDDGHLVMVTELADGTEVEIAKTTIPLAVSTFNVMMGSDQDQNFPNASVVNINQLWDVVHDLDSSEDGIVNGIEDHTVIKSGISIEMGEKIMFMLDEVGQGDFFGTNYTNAATGIGTAEEQLDNTFVYQTNEALVFTQGGANDWNMNTNAGGYFFAASLDQYREGGGSGTVQGQFSLRFNTDGKLTIYDEDAGIKVATAKNNPTVGSSVHFYMGVRGNRAYYSIPAISKQTIGGGSQPVQTYAPTVANQTVSVEEAASLNFTIVSSDNIVNQFVETDAPAWMFMNQTTGVLSGTAPAFLGTAADTIVVNCKAGNAVGGTTNFTVTVSVTEIAYSNSNSLSFDGTSSFLNGDATLMNAMDRATNGDGNAWSLSMWIKPNNNTATQTLLVYGAGDDVNGGTITIRKINANNIIVLYGKSTENILTMGNAFTHGQWSHVLVVFDGGTTGNDANDLADYYSRFKIYVNGSLASTIGVNSNNGYTGAISGADTSDNIFRIGRASNVHDNYFDGIINQVGIWGSDQSANISDIYNSGTTHDLSDLTASPDHYYEIETSVTSVPDIVGSANLSGFNFVAADLVTDTP